MTKITDMIALWNDTKSPLVLSHKCPDLEQPAEAQETLAALPADEEQEAYAALAEISASLQNWQGSLTSGKEDIVRQLKELDASSTACMAYAPKPRPRRK